jgi:hypothetical protein
LARRLAEYAAALVRGVERADPAQLNGPQLEQLSHAVQLCAGSAHFANAVLWKVVASSGHT